MPFIKLQRPREFKIETYYYHPEDQNVDPKRRIHFRRIRHYKKGTTSNPVRMLLIIALLLFVIYYFQKKSHFGEPGSTSGRIQVEEIIIED